MSGSLMRRRSYTQCTNRQMQNVYRVWPVAWGAAMRAHDMPLLKARFNALDAQMAGVERDMQNADPDRAKPADRNCGKLQKNRRNAAELTADLRLEEARGRERSHLWNGPEAVFNDPGAFLDRVTHSHPPPK